MSLHARVLRLILNAGAPAARQKRMQQFEITMGLRPGMRVIDLGGSTKLWRHIRTPLDIAVLNLPSQPIDETQ